MRGQVAAGCAPALPDLATWTFWRLQVVSRRGTHGQPWRGAAREALAFRERGREGQGRSPRREEKPRQCESQAHDFSSKIEQVSSLLPFSLFQGMIGGKPQACRICEKQSIFSKSYPNLIENQAFGKIEASLH